MTSESDRHPMESGHVTRVDDVVFFVTMCLAVSFGSQSSRETKVLARVNEWHATPVKAKAMKKTIRS